MSIDRDLCRINKSRLDFDKDISSITNYLIYNYDMLLSKLIAGGDLKKRFGSLTLDIHEAFNRELHLVIGYEDRYRSRLLQIRVTKEDIEFGTIYWKLITKNKLDWFRIKVYLLGVRKTLFKR